MNDQVVMMDKMVCFDLSFSDSNKEIEYQKRLESLVAAQSALYISSDTSGRIDNCRGAMNESRRFYESFNNEDRGWKISFTSGKTMFRKDGVDRIGVCQNLVSCSNEHGSRCIVDRFTDVDLKDQKVFGHTKALFTVKEPDTLGDVFSLVLESEAFRQFDKITVSPAFTDDFARMSEDFEKAKMHRAFLKEAVGKEQEIVLVELDLDEAKNKSKEKRKGR